MKKLFLILICFCASVASAQTPTPSPAATRATVDSISTATSTLGRFSVQHSNAGNLLIVFVHHTDVGPSAISYEGANLTKRVNQQADPAPSFRELEAWYLLSPAVGAGTVSVTTTSPRSLVTVISFKGASQSAPIVGIAHGTSKTPSITMNANADDLVVDSVGIGPGVVAGSGQIVRASFNDGVWTSASSTKTGSGSVTMSWDTVGIVSDWAQIALVIKPLTSTPSPSPSPSPEQQTTPPACGHAMPQFVQLFGPVQEEGAYTQQATAVWMFPGSATSTSTKKFHFPFQYPMVREAIWRVEWRPYSSANRLRLITMDDGPVNISTMAEIAGQDTSNPTAVSLIITNQINALITAKQPKSIGWQIKGGGPVTVYQSHLELHFCLP